MICEKCGKELIEGVYRCPDCGHFIPDPYADDTDIYIEDEISEAVKNPTLQTITKNTSQINYAKILKPVIKILIAVIVICAITLSSMLIVKKVKEGDNTPSDNNPVVANTTIPSSDGQVNQVQQQIADNNLQNQQENSPKYLAYSCNGFTALISGNFYMDCDIDDGSGNFQNFKLAYSGDNMEMTCETDGLTLTILKLNGNNYFVDLNSRTYINLSKSVMNLMGMDESELELSTGFPNANCNFTFGKKTLNDGEYITASYNDENGLLNTLFIKDGKLIRMESYAPNGSVTGVIKFNEVTGVIPPHILTLDGYQSTTMMNFVTKVISQQQLSQGE